MVGVGRFRVRSTPMSGRGSWPATAPDTVLGFAILVAVGVSVAGWLLLRRRPA